MLKPSKILIPGRITIKDPYKVHDALDPHVKYKVRMSEHPGIVVERRYNDFLWLAMVLTSEMKDCVVPSLPKKKTTGRFDDAFIETRRIQLEDFMNSIAEHLVLSQSPHFETFLVAPSESFYIAKSKYTSSWTLWGTSKKESGESGEVLEGSGATKDDTLDLIL